MGKDYFGRCAFCGFATDQKTDNPKREKCRNCGHEFETMSNGKTVCQSLESRIDSKKFFGAIRAMMGIDPVAG